MKNLMLALSGGVDSSVALTLLKNEYNIIGATMKLYDGAEAACDEARSVAERFGISHHVFDLKEQFKQKVIESFVNSYISGETPNPCVVCNKHIKFGAFLDCAESLGCDYFATGHYARVEFDKASGRFLLKKALSPKDQSYVLYGLSQEQLSRIIFPLGDLKGDKKQVRELAREHGLNADKPDSQDICFIPDGDYAGYIERFIGKSFQSGDIIDKNGKLLGRHNGIINYTIGQRKGLGLAAPEPLYVTGKNAKTGTVTAGGSSELFSSRLTARELNWIAFPELKETLRLSARTRYSGQEQPCTVSPTGENCVHVAFDSPQRALTPGQSVVFYDEDVVIGGGTIQLTIDN
ncbi:MAG: tRNA 2-thiouridine(34) synthase MnmA [Oscillospiraceae bacterium]|nr:tRNA 2-thiouridine(34) synthase MnmA [Oscillospiraceae bacterium]